MQNFSIAVKKRGDEITFLRRIVRGGADDSFGIEVAKLAGVPDKVVRRAKQVLQSLESGEAVTVPEERSAGKARGTRSAYDADEGYRGAQTASSRWTSTR